MTCPDNVSLRPLLAKLRTYLRQSGFCGVMLTRAELELLVGAIDPSMLPGQKRNIDI